MDLLDLTFYDNPVRAWAVGAGVALVVFAAMWLVEWVTTRRFRKLAERSHNYLDDIVVEVMTDTRGWFHLTVALWAGSFALILPENVRSKVGRAAALLLVVQIVIWGHGAVRCWVKRYSERHMESDPAAVTSVKAIGFISRLILYAMGFLVALQTVGIQVTALIAGLGIGGVAIALAVQNILGDLFASLSIVLDKPFVLGDFIIVGDLMGTVEHIGLKTTRVRSLSGEQLVFGNSDLLSSRIRNFKRMYERRIVFGFGVTYQTPPEKLLAIPPKVREIVEAQEQTRFDRAHFKAYGDSSLDFEVVYYVTAPDYNVYMDVQQAINIALYRYFEEIGVDFAYPTRTLFLEGGAAPPLAAEPAPPR